ncbi:MAG TPA: hypothetical protein VF916_06550 [Ktedonobacterales bacterium]|jgi:DNA-binding transcriptional MerR regulator
MRRYEDLLIDALLDRGFTVEEAQDLIDLQERVQREQQDRRRQMQQDAWRSEQGHHTGSDRPN